ncbi:HAMP domain-containing sensor histidine kinase [Ruminococcus sp.]|uniref:sensor histidine kinase n=1 Tax=Ruminococcus sp. TaxID=41978 RepID=UPI0025E6108B|nr:HAMP domain-containing sensor histidine kinase [Ruminococcus sp.]
MMKLFRNSEVIRSAYAFILISSIALLSALLYDKRMFIPVLCLCAVFCTAHIILEYVRYRKISDLSMKIDKILHGDENVSFESCSEGEIALLSSEVYKMTVCLREQKSKLLDDKVYLADLLADISHQIRTPLTSINLLVSMLAEPDLTFEKREQTVHKLYGLLSRIDWLITALLKLSKLDAGTVRFNKESVSVKDLLERSCMPVRVPIELHNQMLEIEADGELSCDVAWTCEAIGNIIKNCMEHTPDGGSITITGTQNPLFSEIRITDSGNDISDEDLPHIFERFYKGKDTDDKGGFGIGLALARMIITEQNGTLKAENSSEVGAVFTVRFYESTI